MKVVTHQFGELEIAEDQIISFPSGIIGFENCKEFVVIDAEDFEPFKWLISLDNQEFGFPILSPFLFVENYLDEFSPSVLKKISKENSTTEIYCIVTLKGDNNKVTMNLKGPIIIDYQKNEGKQIILTNDDLSVSHPIS